MRSLQVVNSLDPCTGGLAASVLGLSRALSKIPTSVEIVSNDRGDLLKHYGFTPEDRALIRTPNFDSGVKLLFRQSNDPLFCGLSIPNVIHSHGLWVTFNHLACSEARRRKIKLVVQTHGMLDRWALQQRYFKKAIAMHLYQRADLHRADLLVATSPQEFQSIRDFGLKNPVAVIPNGADHNLRCFREVGREDGRPKTALFLSRLHPKKGLDDLLTAWTVLRPQGWRLRIVGDGEPDYVKSIKRRILKDKLIDHVFLEGGCYGEEKYRYYEEADFFILPSYGENFGIVVLEALAHGLPVLTTTQTPWEALVIEKAGWRVEPGVGPLLEGLRVAIRIDNALFSEMRLSAKRLAAQYSWDSTAQKMTEVYQWLLSGGRIPPAVNTD